MAHDDAFCDAHEIVTEVSFGTVSTSALFAFMAATTGAAPPPIEMVTVTLSASEPPGPVHERVKVVVPIIGSLGWLVSERAVHPPGVTEQEAAPFDIQERVTASPEATVTGPSSPSALMSVVTAPGGATGTVMLSEAEPPGPVQVSV